ncbi:MAG: hypothetical protein V3V35_06180, partial [Dehalococcoidia bacterium]
MAFGKLRLGLIEWALFAGLAVTAGLLAWRAQTNGTLALVLGLTLAVTAGMAYVLYRVEARSATRVRAAARPWQETRRPAVLPTVVEADVRAAFRVVGTRGVCVKGRRVGEVVRVGTAGQVSPALCSFGEATVRLAAESGESATKEWCC